MGRSRGWSLAGAAAGGDAVRLTTVDAAKGERQHVYRKSADGRNVLFTVAARPRTSPSCAGRRRSRTVLATRSRAFRALGASRILGRAAGTALGCSLRSPAHVNCRHTGRARIELNTTGDTIVSYDVSTTAPDLLVRRHVRRRLRDRHRRSRRPADSGCRRARLVGHRCRPVAPAAVAEVGQPTARSGCSISTGALSPPRSRRRSPQPLWLSDGERFLISRDRPTRGSARSSSSGSTAAPRSSGLSRPIRHGRRSASPDGRFVAITHEDRRDRNDIMVYDRLSSETNRSSPASTTKTPAFSPDGSLLATPRTMGGARSTCGRPGPGGSTRSRTMAAPDRSGRATAASSSTPQATDDAGRDRARAALLGERSAIS